MNSSNEAMCARPYSTMCWVCFVGSTVSWGRVLAIVAKLPRALVARLF
jgi:hypothetical protein